MAEQAGRWMLYRPPLPKIYTPSSCSLPGAAAAGCDTARCMQRKQLITAKHNHTYADELCDRCECSLCLICAKLVNRWTSPSGQYLESVTTRTHPPFTFAFKPDDDDMSRMRQQLILEPTLTHAWHEATWQCCSPKSRVRGANGIVVDVGGNFGWYTLYSLALGCSVVVFEPIPAYQEVLMLGVSLNPGFRERVELHGNVVYDTPGNYTLRVPIAGGRHRKKLGMTGMSGSRGVLKSDFNAKAYTHVASAVRIDDLIGPERAERVCLLKADVEGYEPQVLQTSQRLLSLSKAGVPNLQLELTRTPKSKDQTCAMVKTLQHLHLLGYDFREASHRAVDERAPVGPWRTAPSAWAKLPPFPSAQTREKVAAESRDGKGATIPLMQAAYDHDFVTHSTNLIGRLDPARRPSTPPPWPTLEC